MKRWGVSRAACLWLGCGLTAAVGGVVLSFVSVPARSPFAICLWRNSFGFACPGCGLTRAFSFLARGEWGLAIEMHPLAPAFAFEALVLWLMWGLWILRRTDGPSQQAIRTLAWTNASALVSVWIIRFFSGSLPV